MTYDPVKPRYTLRIEDKSYEVEGSFALIEACENALRDNIINITMRCPQMPMSEMARLLVAILNCSGEKFTTRSMGDILWNNVGVTSDAYAALCLHVHAFLRIVISRPSDREEETRHMGELLAGLRAREASPGGSTGSSV